jgi:hypothetical protein
VACVVALAVALAVSACSDPPGSSDPKGSAGSGSDAPSCRAAAARAQWPAGVPAAVPRPAGLHVVGTQHSAGITITRFTTTESLVQLADTFRSGLPKAGFELRGGDAEGDEVDQRFGGQGYRGALKLHGSSACRTDGTLVVTRLHQSG